MLSTVKVYLLELDGDDPDYFDGLFRIDSLQYFDEKGNVVDYDDSKWSGFFNYDYQTAQELKNDLSTRLEVDPKNIEII
ncbi:hypothetical protein AWM68_17495 [Fictibacillus phosphorivorans]|uniref:Uncharacterized protein n=1 Tax=Fictibacillus phosphorivorans TaxID=1221500 RepID=A0A163S1M3_9BACL|nr:hypothetical protein [Fictibacillus phosphorivorans]KZE67967.1 hypothetical protein AWM68_17495 [Fictibacillus phosphorivorans]